MNLNAGNHTIGCRARLVGVFQLKCSSLITRLFKGKEKLCDLLTKQLPNVFSALSSPILLSATLFDQVS